jgi:hypothetical protein
MTHGSNYSNTMCQLLFGVAKLEVRRMTVWYIEMGHGDNSGWSQSRDCRLIDIRKVGGKILVARSCS